MRRTYILDTSSLIFDPSVYKSFHHSDIVIPIAVLNELDNLKKQPGEVGRNARVCIKLLDEISNLGDIGTGILIDNDVMVKIDVTYYNIQNEKFSGFGEATYGDTQILACAYMNWLEHPTKDVALVSNDINLRVKAKSRGIEAIAHEGTKYNFNELYSGTRLIQNENAGLDLQELGWIDPRVYGLHDLHLNECVLFQNENGDGIAMGRKVNHEKLKLIKKCYPWHVSARNKEQSFAIELIMDKNIDLVTLIGSAGTGKSIVALAAALEMVINKREYDKLVIYRPIQSVGNEIGFIPGTIEEKLAPWFQAIMDNMENLLSFKNRDHWKRELEMFQKKGQIEMSAITYIRGRSIPNSIIMVDEAQNLTKEEVKTILTRAGENTKIILTGDIEQIDNSNLDATSNGLTYVIEKFKDSGLAGHVTLTRGERSRLASKAAEIL